MNTSINAPTTEESSAHQTDTPRTDAEIWDVVYHHKNEIVVDADFARELERELNELWSCFDKQMEAEAEVERLKEERNRIGVEIRGEYISKLKKIEAEVERLKEQLQQAVEIAEWHMDGVVRSPRKDKLDQLKASLNHTKK